MKLIISTLLKNLMFYLHIYGCVCVCGFMSFIFKIFIYLFIYAAPGLSCGMQYLFSLVAACGLLVGACGLLAVACLWDLVPRPGIEPGPPALGMQSLTHWTTREVRHVFFFFF